MATDTLWTLTDTRTPTTPTSRPSAPAHTNPCDPPPTTHQLPPTPSPSLIKALYVAYFLINGGAMLIKSLCRFLVLRQCPGASCEAEPFALPAEPMTVAYLGPCCGLYLPVKC